MAACVILADKPQKMTLQSGFDALFGPLETNARFFPVGYCGTTAPLLWTNKKWFDGGYATLATEIHDLVVEKHGPVTWGCSSYLITVQEPGGTSFKAPILWAWNEQRELVALAAPCGEYEDEEDDAGSEAA